MEGRARLERVLTVILELTGAEHALLYHRELGAASSRGEPRTDVVLWLQQRMASSAMEQATAVLGPASDVGSDSEEIDVDTVFESGKDVFRCSVLLDAQGEPVMAFALAQAAGPPTCLPAAVDDMLVRYLAA